MHSQLQDLICFTWTINSKTPNSSRNAQYWLICWICSWLHMCSYKTKPDPWVPYLHIVMKNICKYSLLILSFHPWKLMLKCSLAGNKSLCYKFGVCLWNIFNLPLFKSVAAPWSVLLQWCLYNCKYMVHWSLAVVFSVRPKEGLFWPFWMHKFQIYIIVFERKILK